MMNEVPPPHPVSVQKKIKITLPPSVVAKMPSLQNTNLTETGAIINLEIPLSQLRGQASHVISPRAGDGSDDVGGIMPPKPPDFGPLSSSGVQYSPRLMEPEQHEKEQEADRASVQQSSDGEHDGGENDSGRDLAGASLSPNFTPSTTSLKVDMSHTLPTNITVRRLLTECMDPEIVDDLIRGAKIIKVSALHADKEKHCVAEIERGRT